MASWADTMPDSGSLPSSVSRWVMRVLTNNFGLLGYDIISQRGYPVYENSDPKVNPDQQQASQFFTIFNKYTLELRLSVHDQSQQHHLWSDLF